MHVHLQHNKHLCVPSAHVMFVVVMCVLLLVTLSIVFCFFCNPFMCVVKHTGWLLWLESAASCAVDHLVWSLDSFHFFRGCWDWVIVGMTRRRLRLATFLHQMIWRNFGVWCSLMSGQNGLCRGQVLVGVETPVRAQQKHDKTWKRISSNLEMWPCCDTDSATSQTFVSKCVHGSNSQLFQCKKFRTKTNCSTKCFG